MVWQGYYLFLPAHPKEVEGKAFSFTLTQARATQGCVRGHLNPQGKRLAAPTAGTERCLRRGKVALPQLWGNCWGPMARPPPKRACLQDGGTPDEGLHGDFCWKSEQNRGEML